MSSCSLVQIAFEHTARSAAVEGDASALKSCFEEDAKLQGVLGKVLYQHLITDAVMVGASHVAVHHGLTQYSL
jgi:hypothetical protein